MHYIKPDWFIFSNQEDQSLIDNMIILRQAVNILQ